MSRKIKMIGLTLIAICAFGAVSAGAAQAAPNWTIEGKTLAAATASNTETIEVENTESIRLTVPGITLTIECKKLATTGAEIKEEFKDSATSLTFSECKIPGSPFCVVKNLGGVNGTIATPAVKSELKTTDGVVYDYFTPQTGVNFVTIVIEKGGGGCALSTGAGGSEVTGTVALETSIGEAVNLTAGSSEAIQKAATAALNFGLNPAYLDTEVDFRLSGANKGKKWGVNP